MRFKLFFISQLLGLSLFAQQPVSTTDQWKTKFTTTAEINKLHTSVAQTIKGDAKAQTLNDCNYIWAGGEFIVRHRGNVENMNQLYKDVPTISLDDAVVNEFLKGVDAAQFVDHYYMLQGLKRGEALDEVRDGITATTFFQTRALNANDYKKLNDAFSCKSNLIHEGYMKRMGGMFQNHGCTPEINQLMQLVKKNVADSDLKKEVMEIYQQFSLIMPGKKAPVSTLKDVSGKEHTFAEFKGKVVVIDTWATWCCSCLEKMPKYVKLRQEFKDRDDVVFVTVSIDRAKAKAKWQKILDKFQMEEAGLVNLIPDLSSTSQFEVDYHVMGVPRYIMIDKQGNLITAFAPSPGEEMKKLILNALK